MKTLSRDLWLLSGLMFAGLAALGQPTAFAAQEGAGKQSALHPAGGLGSGSYLSLQQFKNEGYYSAALDLEDADAVFWHVFSKLPDEVTIYPSENYFYWVLHISGREVYGNIRLPAGRRENGVLSFGYAEFVEFPGPMGAPSYASRSKYFTDADGLLLKELDKFTWQVTFRRKAVTFHLHKLSTEPPKKFNLRTNEVFIERTFDESGMQFFLLFNTDRNYFFWVLNEEEVVPDNFVPLDKETLLGRRTGFAFWLDGEKPARKVLASVRKISVTRNDYYDGPFDQLADNYVEVNKISQWIERAIPSIKGRIDKYGYYTDQERPSRVALSCYGTYYTQAEVLEFIKKAKEAADPYQYISRGGVPLPGSLEALGTNFTATASGLTNYPYRAGLWTNLYSARTNPPATVGSPLKK